MSNLSLAILIASKSHLNQLDKGGHTYILHPIRIMMRLRTTDEELMSMAIMHDSVEDGTITFDEMRQRGFSERVIAGLRLLTHQKGVSYEEYIDNMRGNIDALRVKREDLKDNSDITRLKGVSEKDVKRMIKYQNAFLKVEQYIKEYYEANKPLN